MLNPEYRFAVLLLAAGLSTRLPGEPKLLKPWRGRVLIEHSLDAIRRVSPAQTIVVVNDATAPVCAGRTGLTCVHVNHPEQGLGASIAAGVPALQPNLDGVFIALADMPLIRTDTYDQLSRAFRPASGITVVRPRVQGHCGHPVLFGRRHWDELAQLSGDTGARSILASHPDRTTIVDVDDPGCRFDLDREADFHV